MQAIDHAVMWTRTDGRGSDACWLGSCRHGWRIGGSAIFARDGRACQIGYLVSLDEHGRTVSANVFGTIGTVLVDAWIVANASGTWRMNDVECESVHGATDLDLAFTPATALLCLRRRRPRVDTAERVALARLDLDALTLAPCTRWLRRIGDDRYECRDDDAGRGHVLRVDAAALPMDVGTTWRRERFGVRLTEPPIAAPRRVHEGDRDDARHATSDAGD